MRSITALILLLFSLASCASNPPNLGIPGNIFWKKYGKEIEVIKEERRPIKKEKTEKIDLLPPTRGEIIKSTAEKVEYYPYVDIAQLGDKPKNTPLPNRETYEKSNAIIPPGSVLKNIFVVRYNLALHPPFHRIGAEFDEINIPKSDAFGVATELAGKTYLLVGNSSLQRAIDLVNSQKDLTDIEVSRMLVREKRNIGRQSNSEQTGLTTSIETTKKKKEQPKEPIVKQNSEKKQVSGFVTTVIKNKN